MTTYATGTYGSALALLACALLAPLTACQPTGDSRCDAFPDAVAVITVQGYDLDCNPSVIRCSSKALACTVPSEATVYVWPERVVTLRYDAYMHRVLLHEAGHTLGYWPEWLAELYAFCHMPNRERVQLNAWVVNPATGRWPVQGDCWRVA